MMRASFYSGKGDVTYRPTVPPYKIMFKSTDNVVLLNFKTNESRGFSGFKPHYKTIKTVYDCGKKHWRETYRIFGRNKSLEQIPWQVQTVYIGCKCECLHPRTRCSDICSVGTHYKYRGTILNKRWIVKATHCLKCIKLKFL